MSASTYSTVSSRYRLTPKARRELQEAEECVCQPKFFQGQFQCLSCGTVYGLVREIWADNRGRAS